ncbi:MAG: retropepsin-like aspartic protease [Acidobacteriota bacterium]
MRHLLDFQERHQYEDVSWGIPIPVVLRVGLHTVDLKVKLDTGAQYCVFEREVGERLGLTIEDGQVEQKIQDASGNAFDTFGHEVTIEVLEFEVVSTVFFAKDPGLPRRNVLGRVGWLDRFRVALIDYDRELYLSPYDD